MSDPSVQEMTHAQWLIEAAALREHDDAARKERTAFAVTVFKAAVHAFRDVLVSTLGLNIGTSNVEKDEDAPPRITPFVVFVTPPERLEDIMRRAGDNEEAESAVADDNLDTLNEQLARLDIGELEPLFTEKTLDPYERWLSPENVQALRLAGVDLRHDEDTEVG